MAGFVKLDVGILNSTLWGDRDMRDVFITALLMAEPREIREPLPQIATRTLELTGWTVPAGWYGWIETASTGLIARTGISTELGLKALEALASPDQESRSQEFDGRRLVRVNGGYVVLNYIRYRERDYTAADRMRRWRDRQKTAAAGSSDAEPSPPVTTKRHRRNVTRNVTQAEGEAEGEGNKKEAAPSPSLHPRKPATAATGKRISAIDKDRVRMALGGDEPLPLLLACGATVKGYEHEWARECHNLRLLDVLLVFDWRVNKDDPIRLPRGFMQARTQFKLLPPATRKQLAVECGNYYGVGS